MPRGPESLGEWELPKLRAAFNLEVAHMFAVNIFEVLMLTML